MKGSRPQQGAAGRHGASSLEDVSRRGTPWWEGAVGYQIYVRSFSDGNDDGMGDLRGIVERLDYLSWLGVDAVWLTPFYPTPGHDHGYDVSDYCDVSPEHGSLDDFDYLVERAHSLGLRVIVDLVPNHTSIEHEWFVRARKGRDSPGRDRYLWADPAPDGGPPNNWRSHFGGPAWTLDEVSGQYWCHLFLPEQPDLNWRNEEVRASFDEILRWWIQRSVDGFRIDVASGLVKDVQLRDNPQIAPVSADMDPFDAFASFDHRHDMDQPETVDVFRRWRRVCEPHDVMLLGEVGLSAPERVARYVAPGVLDRAFFLPPSWMAWSPTEIVAMLRSMHRAASGGVSWVLSNHDRMRVAERFGGADVGPRRALALTTLMMALGGMPFLYQGEELALCDGVLRAGGQQDPVAVRNPGAVNGRDGCRTPMPWDGTAYNGFSTGAPWIDFEPRPVEETVAGQRGDPRAPVHRYRDLLAARRRHPDLWRAPAEWIETADPLVVTLRRGSAAVIANLSNRRTSVRLDSPGWGPVFASRDGCRVDSSARDTVSLPAESTVMLVNGQGS